jgi:hypothetical protein
MNLDDAFSVPGMLTKSEREKLYSYASQCTHGCILELGVFFGASAVALSLGAAQGGLGVPVLAVDAFTVSKSHPFAKHVIEYAEIYNLNSLLDAGGGSISWIRIPESYIKSFCNESCTLIQRNISQHELFHFVTDDISLLHLDLPKNLQTMEPIAKNILPRLKSGALIAFQDHGYHFSGDLIAFFEYLFQLGWIDLVDYSGSTLYASVTRMNSMSSKDLHKALYLSRLNAPSLITATLNRLEKTLNSLAKSNILLASAYAFLENSTTMESQRRAAQCIADAAKCTSIENVALPIAERLTESVLPHT